METDLKYILGIDRRYYWCLIMRSL
jgi:hypothetical protein